MTKYKLFVAALLMLASSSVQPIWADSALHDLIGISTAHLHDRPDNLPALLNRAKHYLRSNQNALALIDIKTAEGYSDDIETAYLLGEYFIAERQYHNAALAYSKYLTRYPVHTPSIHGRALANSWLGLTKRSVWDYQYLLSVSKKPSPDYFLELSRLEASIEPHGIYMALATLDRGMEELGLLASLQIPAIEFEIRKNDLKQALARHETLEPWLGKSPQWRNRHQQISSQLIENTREEDSKPPSPP